MKKLIIFFFILLNVGFARELSTSLEAILGSVDVGHDNSDTPVGLQVRIKGYDEHVAGELGLRGLYSSSFSNYSLDYVQGWTFGKKDKAYVSVLPLGVAYDYYDIDYKDTRAWVLSYKAGVRAGYKFLDAAAFYNRALLGRKVNNIRFKPEKASVQLGANFILPNDFNIRFGVEYEYIKDLNSDIKADEYLGNFSLKKTF